MHHRALLQACALLLAFGALCIASCLVYPKSHVVLEETTTSTASADWKPEGKVPTIPFSDWYRFLQARKAD